MSYHEKRTEQRERIRAAMAAPMPARLYRADLFRKAKDSMIGGNVSALGVREIAAETGLAENTVQAALKGDAIKTEVLWKLAQYFGVDWLGLFDVDRVLKSELPAELNIYLKADRGGKILILNNEGGTFAEVLPGSDWKQFDATIHVAPNKEKSK